MAQANTAQREPSMEEILASIRRIIEDGDGGRTPDRAAANDARLGHTTVVEIDPEADPEPELEAFRAELAAEPDSGGAEREPIHRAESGLLMREVEQEARTAAQAAQELPAAPAQGLANGHLLQELDDAVEPASDEIGQFPDETVAGPRPSLLSERSGRQVAAAFEELSEAFAASRRRSFDEMAEEMLRPMLQDWLDNNLPHLVERLVREEIERIARGGAR